MAFFGHFWPKNVLKSPLSKKGQRIGHVHGPKIGFLGFSPLSEKVQDKKHKTFWPFFWPFLAFVVKCALNPFFGQKWSLFFSPAARHSYLGGVQKVHYFVIYYIKYSKLRGASGPPPVFHFFRQKKVKKSALFCTFLVYFSTYFWTIFGPFLAIFGPFWTQFWTPPWGPTSKKPKMGPKCQFWHFLTFRGILVDFRLLPWCGPAFFDIAIIYRLRGSPPGGGPRDPPPRGGVPPL